MLGRRVEMQGDREVAGKQYGQYVDDVNEPQDSTQINRNGLSYQS